MIKYIAAERDTPDVPRTWGEGKTVWLQDYNVK